jgi:hypothetical protein
MVTAQELIDQGLSSRDLREISMDAKLAGSKSQIEQMRASRADAGARRAEAAAMKQKYRFLKNQNTRNVEGFKKIQKGIVGAVLNPGIPSQSSFYGSSQSGGAVSRGRGRPVGTYTYVIPGMGPVPIQAYKRWQSQQRAMQRVQNELMKARFNMQPSAQEMPQGYGQFSAEDAFAGQEDNAALQQFQMQQAMAAQQAQQQVARPGMLQRFTQMFNPQPQQGPNMVPRAPMAVGTSQMVPRMGIWNGGGLTVPRERNILNAPNVFNRPGETTIGVARRQSPY